MVQGEGGGCRSSTHGDIVRGRARLGEAGGGGDRFCVNNSNSGRGSRIRIGGGLSSGPKPRAADRPGIRWERDGEREKRSLYTGRY